jgi:PTH1 family peptidyl-tRNA hydrolase
VLAKPLTYMNDSGLAVRKLAARERAPLHDLLVVTDDFSLPFGKMRFREGGSHGGHNGLRSIIEELATEAFPRLRIGIGEPGRDAVDHVLSVFQPAERQRLDELLDAAADAVEAWARDGVSKASNRFNAFQLRPPDEARTAAPGDIDGPPGVDGVRRTRTGWRRTRPDRPDEPGS